MTAEWHAIADAGAAQTDFFRMLASEHRQLFGESARVAASIGSFGLILAFQLHVNRPRHRRNLPDGMAPDAGVQREVPPKWLKWLKIAATESA